VAAPFGRDAGQASGKLGTALIVSQIAISLVLLQAAGLFLRSLGRLKSFDPGFDRRGVLELDLNTRPHGYDGVAIGAYRAQVAEAVAGLPSVQSVAYASSPILGGDQGWKDAVSSIEQDGDGPATRKGGNEELVPHQERTRAKSAPMVESRSVSATNWRTACHGLAPRAVRVLISWRR
jgi:hypothetical protein